MKSVQKFILLVLMLAGLAGVRFMKKSHTQSAEIVVGTSADFPPFSYIDQSAAIVGFDIDLIREIFARLSLQYRLENMPFETLLPQMQFGSIDLIAAGMSPTPERAARILFSKPYLSADPLVIVTRADSTISSLADLSGKEVAVNQGYVADMQLSARPEIKLLRLPGMSDALLALTHGKVEAFVTGARTVKPLKQVHGDLRVVPINELQESTALGISRQRPELREKIDEVLETMAQDGTLSALMEKWQI